jgi:hypothetical protein
MVITIAILALLGMIFSIFQHANDTGDIDMNVLFPAILTIVLWDTNVTLSIITISISAIILVVGQLDK